MSVSEPITAVPRPRPWSDVLRESWARYPVSAEREAWIGLAGLLVTGLVIALSASSTSLLLPQTIRLGPTGTGMTGAFGQHGIDLHLAGLTLVLVVMFASYTLVVRGAAVLPARAVLIGIATILALVMLAPPLFSTDVFSYIAYGRLGRIYSANPYVFGPSFLQLDKVYPFIDQQWVTTPTAYGPIFTALSYLLAPLAIAAEVVAYKAIAAGALLLVCVMVWKAAALRGVNQVKAVALVGLNPATIAYGVGGGHNDMLMLALLVTGIYVLLLERQRTGGALIVAATAVKLTGGLLAPFALARHGGRGTALHSRRAVLAGLSLAAALAAAFSFGLFGTGPLHLLGTLQSVQSQGGIHSIPGLLLSALGLSALSGAVGIMLDVALVICVGWLVRRVWVGELDWITGAGWATVGLLLSAGLLLPWYVGWLTPLAALSKDRRLLVVSMLLTALALTSL
jgi:hypothetical protein